MSKELYMATHEALVAEYLSEFPHISWAEAYDATADAAWDRMRDDMADRADYYRDLAKEGKL